MNQTPPRRRRHLMDPDAPPPVRDHAAENESLSQVQRWVMSVLAVTTIFHQKKPYSPWVLVGLIPAAIGTWLIYS